MVGRRDIWTFGMLKEERMPNCTIVNRRMGTVGMSIVMAVSIEKWTRRKIQEGVKDLRRHHLQILGQVDLPHHQNRNPAVDLVTDDARDRDLIAVAAEIDIVGLGLVLDRVLNLSTREKGDEMIRDDDRIPLPTLKVHTHRHHAHVQGPGVILDRHHLTVDADILVNVMVVKVKATNDMPLAKVLNLSRPCL